MRYRIALKRFFSLLLCLCGICCACAQSKSVAYCDSIIKAGVVAIMYEKDYVKAVELLEEARTLAEQKQWHKQQFLAINNIGIMYHMMLDYGEALNYFLEAYTISLKHLDDQQTMVVLNNIAIMYSKEKDHVKAMEYFGKAYDMAKKNDDPIKMGSYAMNMGIACNKMWQLEQAEVYFEEALHHLAKRPEKVLETKRAMIEMIFLKGAYQQTIAECKKLLPEAERMNYLLTKQELYYLIAQAYHAEKDLENATYYARKALQKNNMENRAEIYATLSRISYDIGNCQAALAYTDSVVFMHDSLAGVRSGRLFENSKVKFELQSYQHELSLKEAQLANSRKVLYAILGLIFIALLFLFWWLHARTVRQQQKKKTEKAQRRIIELELERERSENLLLEKQLREKETVALLEQERLKNEIELRNRQLSAKALFLASRDQVMEEMVTYLSKYPALKKDTAFSEQLKTLKNQLNSEKEWDLFIAHFEEVNRGILSILKQKHPGLNSNDLRFISYIYMNLNAKEIASMLNITLDACRKRKERLCKKMNLDEENNLYDYLFSLNE